MYSVFLLRFFVLYRPCNMTNLVYKFNAITKLIKINYDIDVTYECSGRDKV